MDQVGCQLYASNTRCVTCIASYVMRALVWLGFVLLCNGAGYASSLFSIEGEVYQNLAKPEWAPPGWVFGPVWTALYTLMGTATYVVWRHCRGEARSRAMIVFAVQLALNVSWTPVFFGLQRYGVAVIVILAVLAAVTAMLVAYWRRNRLAGALVVPLWLWVGFAAVLNIRISQLNS